MREEWTVDIVELVLMVAIPVVARLLGVKACLPQSSHTHFVSSSTRSPRKSTNVYIFKAKKRVCCVR